MKKIVIYWKWWIWKSTISTHLSISYALKNNKVLQVWCDPKHDSCKRLLERNIPTVIDLTRDWAIESLKMDKIIAKWKFDIDCIEVWWPIAWMWCAGRWVSLMFEIFEENKIFEKNKYDVVVFDVLWDVVCWWFAAPLKVWFADLVYVVVSEEIMSIYAANNISKAVLTYSRNWVRLGWLIVNLRDNSSSIEHIKEFAKRIWTSIVWVIPRSSWIIEAERMHKTLFEIENKNDGAFEEFNRLSDYIYEQNQWVIPKPLGDVEFDDFISSYFRLNE